MFKKDSGKPNPVSTISLGVTIASIYTTLLAYASATQFRAGYLEHFEIDIRSIDYQPSVVELMGEPIFAIITIAVALILFMITATLANFVSRRAQSWARDKGKTGLYNFLDEDVFDLATTVTLSALILIAIPICTLLPKSYDRGTTNAGQQNTFIILKSYHSNKQVLIHQFNGTGLFKTYNTEANKFESGYRTMSVYDREFEVIELIDN